MYHLHSNSGARKVLNKQNPIALGAFLCSLQSLRGWLTCGRMTWVSEVGYLPSVVRLLGKPGARCIRRTMWSLPGSLSSMHTGRGAATSSFWAWSSAGPRERWSCRVEICVLPRPSLWLFSLGQGDLVAAFHLEISGRWRLGEGFKSVYSVYIIEILRRISSFLLT